MRFTLNPAPVPLRRFLLPAHEPSTAPAPLPELDKPVRAPVWGPGLAAQRHKRGTNAQTPRRTSGRRVEAQTGGAHGLLTVTAPVGPRKGRTVLDFTAASAAPMPAFLGTIKLRIDRDAVNLERLELGLLSLCVDHDVSQLMGRVVEATIHGGYAGRAARLDMLAEVSTTPTATNAMDEIGDLTRAGFSPGFLIDETVVIDPDSPDYDEQQMFQIEVTRWTPFECSSTPVPRSTDARLKGVASMGNVIAMDVGVPEVVSTSDMVGLSLAAGREVLRSGSGSESQRGKLREFFKVFDAGLENGLSRDAAAVAAKLAVGL